ncbi:MAG: hypothetical protein ACSLE2_07330 [Lysobacterales bacterium]
MFRFEHADEQESGFIGGLRRDLQQIWIIPQPLSLNEVDAVLLEIGLALGFVKLKHGIKSMPFSSAAMGISSATNYI